MKRLSFIVLLFLLFAFPSAARADVAPPIYPPGSNLQPGEEVTQVRMAAETVVIEVQKDITPEGLGRAHVSAEFNMQNLGAVDEKMAVRFPISSSNGRGEYPEIENVQIQIEGNQVRYQRVNYPDVHYSDKDIPWAEFNVTFPVQKNVSIRVDYDLKGSGYYPYTAFYYILETGAGWKGTIGSADVILRLPYEASPQNIVMGLQIGWAETTPGGVFQGREVLWHFDDFEPGANQPVQNMEFALVAPSAWQTVLNAQDYTVKHSSNGEGWGILAKAYKEIFQMNKGYREDTGGEELYKLSVAAYEKCLSLKPDDAQWHAGFADLLADRYFWDRWKNGTTPEAIRALDEIHTALQLAPNDPVVREIAQNITYMIEGGITQNGDNFDFPWLTQTPTVLPPTPTMFPINESTATPLPLLTDTPRPEATRANSTQVSATPTPQRSNPICGSAAFLPIGVMLWFAWKRK